jgi:uncharacterized protein
MYNRLFKLSPSKNTSYFLFGPRGTGKTSWIKQALKKCLYLDLLDFSVYTPLAARPDRLESMIAQNFLDIVVIDEVQRIPALLNEVHRLIENKKIRFLLTGSSARNLRKKGVNSLAGRALTYTMHPLIAQEVGADFDLTFNLQYGLLPSVIKHTQPKKYLESYIQTYIREEVFQESLTRNIGAFNRFLEVASFSQGSLINYSEIARELSLNRLLVSDYFQILEDLLIAKRISAFNKRAKRKTISQQKFYFFDTGVYRILKPSGPLDTKEEIEEAALETLFFQSINALNDYLELGYQLYFWRTSSGTEVDFIAYGPRGLHAFEIKRSDYISPKHLKGLKSFKKDYPEAQLYLLYLGKTKETHDDITVLSLDEALKTLEKIL